ncbi:hypothetical protein [Ruminiclostridium cellobioparum]|uniref:hypothetical protein n=1 Tax=Ruminiclostridium cellobioparum TaxID=29355 RepID=UPI0028AAFFD5|nr:hypothetical protein [Ruminiclostridium cellobioparum]
MINRKLITREQAVRAIETGEFGKDILTSKPRVVIILTQDWCPQWHDMRGWLYEHDTREDIDIYELEYNKTDFFDEFRNFKENRLGNDTIPYVRFYREGVLYRESNYISEGQFFEILSM